MQIKIRAGGFTVLELLVVVCVLFILVTVVFCGVNRGREKALRINCVCHLKQIGLGYRLWSGDHNDLYPTQYFTNQTGGMLYADATNGFRYLQVLSNELVTPKVLVCPADRSRKAATNFNSDFAGNRISYFVGLEANETTHPFALLSGDRNITNGENLVNGMLEVTTNQNIGWTSDFHQGTGNVGIADGSVQQLTANGLKVLIQNMELATNRLLFP